MCRLIHEPVENNDPMPPPNFEFPVYEAEEDELIEIPKEVTRLLEHEERTIQPYKELLEVINLGSEYDVKYHTQKAIKGSVLADHLAHQAIEDY